MYENYPNNGPALQGLLSAAGYSTPAVEPMTVRAEPNMGLLSPAVMPMTTAAAPSAAADYLAGLDFSGFSGITASDPSLGGFGLGMTPGYVRPGGVSRLITAPISNKGNPTAYGANNQFRMLPDQFVRLVDRNTNTVLFEGTGFEAAEKAVQMGQGLTDKYGRKANYQIQTGTTQDNYQPVANEKYNKSTLSKVANVAGTVLPLAMIPLTMGSSALLSGLSTAGKIGLGAAVGGVSSGLKGDDILKGAAMGGLSAAGGQLLGPALGDVGNMGLRAGTAIGTGLGATAGGLVTGQSLQNSLLGGVASGALSYVTPDIAEGLGIGQGTSIGTGGGGDGYTGINVVGSAPASIGLTLGGSPNKIQQALGQGPEAPYSGLTVTGGQLGGLAGVNIGGQYGAPVEGPSLLERLAQPEPSDVREIDVFGNRIVRPVSVPVTGALSPDVLAGIAEFEKNPIISEGSKIKQAIPVSVPVTGALPTDIVVNAVTKEEGLPEGSVVAGLPITGLPTADTALTGGDGKKLGVNEYLRIAGLLSTLIGGVSGGGGGAGTGAPYVSPFGPGVGIGLGPGQDMRAVTNIPDYERYGFGPEATFFRPEYSLLASGGAAPAQAQSAMPTAPTYRPLI